MAGATPPRTARGIGGPIGIGATIDRPGIVHTMPPAGGVGANTALPDAQTLATELLTAARGEQSLIAAVGAYEVVMLPRGFATADASPEMAAQLFGSSV
ncbi:FAD-dependent monooxygenase [Nocardia sp. NBC_01388]|uniref:FAD-dependent monooxygenase n=1 Tax=Nocardia sp. NBC_01388 TaxID=2903596 RepID=UPI0032500A93